MMQNKRENARKPVSVPASIASGDVEVQGTILDLSSRGARVRLAANAFLSTQCTLTASLFGTGVPSRIVWRRGSEIGLRFKTTVALKQGAGWPRAGQAPLGGGGFGRRSAD